MADDVDTNGAENEDDDIGSSPTLIRDPRLRLEAGKALMWVLVVGSIALAVYLSSSLLVIFGALVFAAMLDGGARLLGRILPVPRALRVVIVILLALAFIGWLILFAGQQIVQEAAEFPEIIEAQLLQLLALARDNGLAVGISDLQGFAGQMADGVGTITRAIGGVIGGVTTLFLIVIIGLYVALEPRLYERGVEWLFPRTERPGFRIAIDDMAFTMRRLMAGRLVGMVIEGIFTWALLAFWGVPMAALLGLLTGLLAFIPNIGAVISGVLMVLVGFSGGTDMGLYTIFVYFFVQTIDGYVLVPMIAKKTVDLAPALVLGAQLILGVLFGILGLALADPLMAMIKVALEHRAARNESEREALLEARS
jgi:predicted PurR-regulated permease PerM